MPQNLPLYPYWIVETFYYSDTIRCGHLLSRSGTIRIGLVRAAETGLFIFHRKSNILGVEEAREATGTAGSTLALLQLAYYIPGPHA